MKRKGERMRQRERETEGKSKRCSDHDLARRETDEPRLRADEDALERGRRCPHWQPSAD